MATFKVRVTKPRETDWIELEGETIGKAVQEYHFQNVHQNYADIPSVGVSVDKEKQWFTLFETESGEELLSRICTSGIYRAGGVRPSKPPMTLADVAKILGVEESKLTGEWPGEEDY
jgi:hypothetical protein